MAIIKNIYFQSDVAKKIEKEKNLSQLISNLLRRHYEIEEIENLEEIDKKIKEIEIAENKFTETKKQELEKLQEMRKEKEEKIKKQKEQEERIEKKKKERIEGIKRNFKDITGREIKEEEIEEFLESNENIFKFADKKKNDIKKTKAYLRPHLRKFKRKDEGNLQKRK